MTDSAPTRRPKLAHVAMAAGVSLGTASDALRGKGRISDETRRRVIAAADSMGYRANANARILALGRSQIVALVAHGPGTGAIPRIYWPRLQASFTERLLEHGMVACTMTLDDLHQLDGLPFDLVVFVGMDPNASLPAEIRSDYRILDIDISGHGPASLELLPQLAGLGRAALDRLTASGSRRPALVFAGGPGAAVRGVYDEWCAQNGVAATAIEVDASDGAAEALVSAIDDGIDGIFSVLADGRWLAQTLAAALPATTGPLPVIALGPAPDGDASSLDVMSLVPDGQSLGEQIAEAAIASLNGAPSPKVNLRFLLNGTPFPVD